MTAEKIPPIESVSAAIAAPASSEDRCAANPRSKGKEDMSFFGLWHVASITEIRADTGLLVDSSTYMLIADTRKIEIALHSSILDRDFTALRGPSSPPFHQTQRANARKTGPRSRREDRFP